MYSNKFIKTTNSFNKINTLYNFFLDLIFPRYCVGCKKEGVWFCEKCKEKIIYIKTPTCPKCSRISENGNFCKSCQKDFSLKGVLVAAHYEEGPLKEAIHTYKYDGIYHLKVDLGKILISTLLSRWNKKDTILIPVPLHKTRKGERGYNQALLLSQEIKKSLNYEICDNKLLRIKYTKPQVKFNSKDRIINIQNSFRWKGKDELKGKTIILIDDVFTTGSTLNECAKELKLKAHVKEVWGLVLAKG